VVVHLATLISVLVAYRVRLIVLARGALRRDREAWRYCFLLLLASVPAGLAGILFREYFERSFHSMPALGWQFLITAGILWSTRYAVPRATGTRVTALHAMLIGAAQALAIVPAISRSGATVAAGLWSGLSAETAAEFSFIMSIVVIAGSGVMEARHIPPGSAPFTLPLLAAFIAAMVSGIFAIRWLVALLRHRKFHLFAPYCAVLGVLCLVWYGWLGK
jgi:undecaprenyl-diphosphatase